MYIVIPHDWGDVVSSRDGIFVCEEYSVESIRKGLENGEKTFLIGADALSDSTGWLLVRDHLALFGTGSLAGPNHPSGPRFPNLRGMYIVPTVQDGSVRSGIVMKVPDTRFSTGAELKAFSCDALVSSGIDLAVAAAHGGAGVVFLLNCRTPADRSRTDFSFLNTLIQETEEVRSSELQRNH
ncbi:MAG: hypothetical protein J7K88_07025 [Candidatus Fermentibacteraceae bacterium]|nr:hypothetical protein [Candidatus Fermentibacteraceae bacterium]